jgi:hypothetical protein
MPNDPAKPPPLPDPRPVESLEAEWQRVLAESQRPLDTGLPPDALASPAHVRRDSGDEVRWWRPSWHDGWQYVGWRWILLAPAILLIVLAVPALGWPSIFSPFVILEVKLLVFVVAIALSLAGYVIRRAARARREPFCIFCGYNLSGLPNDYRCPECGRPYTWRLIGEYRRDPQWFIERYRAHRRLPQADQPFEAGPVRRRRRDGT